MESCNFTELYKEYESREEFIPPKVLNVIENIKVKKKVLFINYMNNENAYERALKIIDAAKKSGYKIYAVTDWDVKTDDEVVYLKRGSNAHYKALHSAKVVYTDSVLSIYYMKQKGQVVFFNPEFLDRSRIDERIIYDSTAVKADWFLTDEQADSVKVMQWNVFLEKFNEYSFKKNEVSDKRKKVLFILNFKMFDTIFNLCNRISQYIDFSKYDVTVLFEKKYLIEYGDYLEKLDENITIVCKKGKTVQTEEVARKLEFLKGYENKIFGFESVEGFLNDSFAQNEIKRLFGTEEFDYVLNMKFESVYWKLIIDCLKGKKMFLDMDNYNRADEEKIDYRAKYNQKYDKILRVSKQKLSECPLADKRSGKYDVMPYMESHIKVEKDYKVQNYSGREVIFIKEKKDLVFDLFSARVLDKKIDKYMVLNPSVTSSMAEKMIMEHTNEGEVFLVFDYYNTIDYGMAVRLNAKGVKIFREYLIYEGLKPYLKNEIKIPNEDMITERGSIDIIETIFRKI